MKFTAGKLQTKPLGEFGKINVVSEVDGNAVAFTGVRSDVRPPKESEANAAEIVRRWNCFPLMLAALQEHVAIRKEQPRLLKEYPPGTCNAEDAWSAFGKRKEANEAAILDAIVEALAATLDS
jgi:hypothetical protein